MSFRPVMDRKLALHYGDKLSNRTNDDPVQFWAPTEIDYGVRKDGPVVIDEKMRNVTAPKRSAEVDEILQYQYASLEKEWPYVGHPEFMKMFPLGSPSKVSRTEVNFRAFNSLAVFPGATSTLKVNPSQQRMHGVLGVYRSGRRAWVPARTPVPAYKVSGGVEAALKNGGFYLDLSNALPLDRDPYDSREDICKKQTYNLSELNDASVVITFFNEPLSTLLRTVHSVLNQTPPPLLREIILVDDHSNLTENLPGGPLYEYVKMLPKTKLMRLPEREGLVKARLAGARAALGHALVVLDSHVEVNPGWLEPQMFRLKESPKSIVFPQILSIDSETFDYKSDSGIGCWISFRWTIVESSSLTGSVSKPDALKSASMAGGLFAVNMDWFWEIGGYDEQFSMWGAENVEMGFRTWMCGGRLECTPCARTYHIYRKSGHAYTSPPASLSINRLRTARVWMDEWYMLSRLFIAKKYWNQIGNIDKMLELKERLNCKPFSWFLKNIDPNHDIQSVEDMHYVGEIKNLGEGTTNYCLDTLGHDKSAEPYGIYWCHGDGGTQGFFSVRNSTQLRLMSDERKCLGYDLRIRSCNEGITKGWEIEVIGKGKMLKHGPNCLEIDDAPAEASKKALRFSPCDRQKSRQKWTFAEYVPEAYTPPEFSDEYKEKHPPTLFKRNLPYVSLH